MSKNCTGDLRGDWRGRVEYATVAIRFSLIDAIVDHATGTSFQ